MTKIVEKYFEKNDFAGRVESILKIVCDETGFVPKKIIYKGLIYDEDKLGSVIYKGKYQEKDAVLKLQGLQPETDEIDIIVNFQSQNKSSRIRLPKLYKYQHWNEQNRYGYLITEYITSPHIFEMPYANNHQMRRFCEFYQEYKENCLNQAFVKQSGDENNAADFIMRRAEMWKRIADAKGILIKRLDSKRVDEILQSFKEIAENELRNVKMVFSHGHLTAADIHDDGNEFVLLSNLYWSYRPEFYDLVFGLHWCIENIKDDSFTFEKYLNLVRDWLNLFYEIPIVAKDPDAKRKIHLMLPERTLGGILLDTGSRPMDDKFTEILLPLQASFFGELAERIHDKTYL